MSGLPERSTPPTMTNNSDNITNTAQNTKHKSINTEIQRLKQNKIGYKNTKISSAGQYNGNTILEVNV